MVRKARMFKAALAIAPLLVCLVLLLAGFGLAQEDEKPTINETYEVTINDVGDGHIVDTIKYSKDDYASIKKVGKENRGFLTRRFTTDDNTGELVDFKTDLDDKNNSVVITYDKPGYAYNQGGEFAIYGFSEEPKKKGGGFAVEETSTINSEFTLFTDQVILTKTSIFLPAAARDTSYDADDKALTYKMPAAHTLLGFWSENKTAMSVVFGLCTLLFAGLLLFVATRKAETVPQVEAAGPSATSAPDACAVTTPPVSPRAEETVIQDRAEQPLAGPAEAAAEEEAPRFCRKCGHQLAAGKSFCTRCGKHI